MSKRKMKEEARAFAEALIAARKKTVSTHKNIETILSIPVSTLIEWENGINTPDADARKSILILYRLAHKMSG